MEAIKSKVNDAGKPQVYKIFLTPSGSLVAQRQAGETAQAESDPQCSCRENSRKFELSDKILEESESWKGQWLAYAKIDHIWGQKCRRRLQPTSHAPSQRRSHHQLQQRGLPGHQRPQQLQK
uniref:NTR domain-containing protein n=1 Tax=Panagrellus redivivus TaxID=6233 RepID=A0A7E4V253_PANRE